MRYDDAVMAVLRESPGPLTVHEILDSMRSEDVTSRYAANTIRKTLATLKRFGMVRQAGRVKVGGSWCLTWEAVA